MTILKLFGVEVEDDGFFGLVRAGFPLASAHRVEGGLGEDGMSTQHGDGLCRSVGRDHGLDAHGSGEMHVVGERGVERHDLGSHLTMAFVRVLLGRTEGARTEQEASAQQERHRAYPETHRALSFCLSSGRGGLA